MSISEPAYYNAFNLMPFMGPAKIRILLSHFGSLENAWRADLGYLIQAGIENNTAKKDHGS